MKRLTIGILAHVDAGKTTLSEALLYRAGALRKLGRVDHRDAFLDTDDQERERGITIFSKQAVLRRGELELTLLDTPGHADFAAEMERAVQALDYAVLLLSGPDGVQGHTETLWRILKQYRVPTFVFVNKMDQPGTDRKAILEQLRRRLGEGFVDVTAPRQELLEQAAVCDEALLERYLEGEEPEDADLAALTVERRLFPCCFGSALKVEGVEELLCALERYTLEPDWGQTFAARVFKISRDERGERLTWLKLTGGSLRVRDAVRGPGWEEKVSQIRLYSGSKFTPLEEAPAGTVCAVTGLSRTRVGQGLGAEEDWPGPELEPVLRYRVLPPEGCDVYTLLGQLRQLEEEDPQLRLSWDEASQAIQVQLMGEVQLEVLSRLIARRFGVEVAFGPGAIVYLETIAAPVEGVGHFEPLRHYAEVHLLLEPAPRGSGLRFATACPEDVLDRNWQRLILTHLMEKEHLGVLTGSPITDLTITLLTGRAHVKHTEGGDFRQATYRAVRQGLMQAQSILLEPWYDLRLLLPPDQVGRAMSDLQRMGGELRAPEPEGEYTLLCGSAPVSGLQDYAAQVAAYTRGLGRLALTPAGYRPCPNQAEIVSRLGYDVERDVENTPDSVFCDHGAGYIVPWDQVTQFMHVDSGLELGAPEEDAAPAAPPLPRKGSVYSGSLEGDDELMAIFERTYGPVQRRDFRPQAKPRRRDELPEKQAIKPPEDLGPEYLLVDGYNIIFAWDELKAVARDNLDAARQRLMDLMSNYQGYKKCQVILVFDAYKVPRGTGEVSRYHNIYVVYTKEAETADAYIEKTTYELSKKKYRVRVATSDYAEQMIILGHGALRLSATTFRAEVEQAAGQIAALLKQQNRPTRSQPVKAALEKARGKT